MHLGWVRVWETSELFPIIETRASEDIDEDSNKPIYECLPFDVCLRARVFRLAEMEEIVKNNNVRKTHGDAARLEETRALLQNWEGKLEEHLATMMAEKEANKSEQKGKKGAAKPVLTPEEEETQMQYEQKKSHIESRIEALRRRLEVLESSSHALAPGQPYVSDRVYAFYRRAALWEPAIRLWILKKTKKYDGNPRPRIRKHFCARFVGDNQAFGQLPHFRKIFKMIMTKVLATAPEDLAAGVLDRLLKKKGKKDTQQKKGAASTGAGEEVKLGAKRTTTEKARSADQPQTLAKTKRRRKTTTIEKDQWDESDSDSSSDESDSDESKDDNDDGDVDSDDDVESSDEEASSAKKQPSRKQQQQKFASHNDDSDEDSHSSEDSNDSDDE